MDATLGQAASFERMGFWDTNIVSIGGGTINHVKAPDTGLLPFTVLLLIAAVLVLFILVLIKRKEFSRRTLVVSTVEAFVAVGLFAAFRMDYNWLAFMKTNVLRNYGKDLTGRIVTIEQSGLYAFINRVKEDVPEGATFRRIEIDRRADRTAYFLTILGNYYLLPVMTSKKGKYVWIYNFHRIAYDPRTMTLRAHRSVFRARVYRVYAPDGAVFEISGRP